MYFINLFLQIISDMWKQKLRSFLTLFGIVWGTFSVVMLLALGNGFTSANEKKIMRLADGVFFIYSLPTGKSFLGLPKGRMINIKASSITALKKAVPNILKASPVLTTTVNLGQGNIYTYVDGVSADYIDLRKIDLIHGSRFINILDENNKARVIVISNKLKNNIFGKSENGIGKTIKINNIPFIVIGVMSSSEDASSDNYANYVFMPYSTYIQIFGDKKVSYFLVFPQPEITSKLVEQSIRAYFAQKYHFAVDDKVAISIFDTTESYQFIRWFFIGLKIFLGFCGALALGVGSLGVANIMFLIVTERTREIGLRLAIGASERQVLSQILFEALIIVLFGGIIGFILAHIVNLILQLAHLPEWFGVPVISGNTVIVTITVLSLFGLLAGYFPARWAAKMDPVDALAH